MTLRGRLGRRLAIPVGILAITVGAAGLAWACSPRSERGHLVVRGESGQDAGPPGSQIRIEGSNFAEDAAVKISWNGGPVIATASGSPFTVTATFPDVPEGRYYIIPSGPGPNGVKR